MIFSDELSKTQDATARLFEELYDPAFLIDVDHGCFAGANAAACRYLGYSSDDFQRLTPADIHPHEIPRLQAFLAQVRREGRWVADDLSCRAQGGSLLPAQVRASCIRIDNREYILAIVRDRQEEQLAELGRSIRKVTHDLRNTMVASQLMGDRLARHPDPLVQRSAEMIRRSVRRSVRMCEAMLEVGNARERAPQLERFTLDDVVEEARAAIGPEEVARASLQAPGADAVVLDADFDQIFRILLNLVRNAVAAGARQIQVQGGQHADTVWVEVADDGPGVPDTVRDELFVEKRTAPRSGGAGLGLAIAWELARNHGGALTLKESGPEGAVFRLTLPRSASPEAVLDRLRQSEG
ncbi:ATP-binding protein [Alkalilimnicola ehrlichii MLHE-1]|nr:PAS domain-containing sensor histidine kinase [Alkalilimnicola ehrlichii]